jgi:hypothetical protein
MRKLYENFHIFYFLKRIFSAETIRGNTVRFFLNVKFQSQWRRKLVAIARPEFVKIEKRTERDLGASGDLSAFSRVSGCF